jgi:hypothetical protein
MNKQVKIQRLISISLLLFTGINAIIAGILFILDPSGKKMGMSTSYLSHSPFSSFLIPGITLFVVNGLLNIFAAFYTIKKYQHYPILLLLQGLLLSGWILLQVFWVRDFNALHFTMLLIGGLLIINGFLLKAHLKTL